MAEKIVVTDAQVKAAQMIVSHDKATGRETDEATRKIAEAKPENMAGVGPGAERGAGPGAERGAGPGAARRTIRRGTRAAGPGLAAARITGANRSKLAAELKTRYDEGESIRALAASTGRSYSFVSRLLSETGVKVAGRRSTTRRRLGKRTGLRLPGSERPTLVQLTYRRPITSQVVSVPHMCHDAGKTTVMSSHSKALQTVFYLGTSSVICQDHGTRVLPRPRDHPCGCCVILGCAAGSVKLGGGWGAAACGRSRLR